MELTRPSALACAILGALAGCREQAAPAAAPGPDAAPTRLEVGYSALRISLPVFVAAEEGIFERHGLDVTLRRYETAQPLVEEVLDGRLQAGGFAALPIVLAAAASDGAQVRLALGLVEDEAHPISYLLRRRGDDSLRSAGDLRGRQVGILPTVAYREWLEAVLRASGVPPDAVTITAVAPPQQVAALAEGGVDALFTNDPTATSALRSGAAEPLGEPGPVPRALGGSLLFGTFLVSPALARERPGDLSRLLAALDEAVERVHADQAAARRAMAPYVRENERAHVASYPDARYLRSDELDEAALRAAVRAATELQLVARAPDVTGWALGAAAPGAAPSGAGSARAVPPRAAP